MMEGHFAEELIAKLKNKQIRLGIIGLGYVGLPWAVEFAKAGFHVVGIDLEEEKTNKINQGISYIPDVPADQLTAAVKSGYLKATTDFSCIQELDSINICVPTPLRKTKDPDISHIVEATNQVVNFIEPGKLIILESTSYPGTTEELVLPILQESGLEVGKDFFLAFSPERVDPGNEVYHTINVPKVVGGVTARCTKVAATLYEQCVAEVVPVSSPRVAEMSKLLENTFRIVNIGLVNEVALMSDKLGIDVWEVIDAASTKPFGFMPFYPGPGLGGHCIPVDPFYLSWKARLMGFEARFIELAGEVNSRMPYYVTSLIVDGLNEFSKSIKGSRIHVLGVAYKKDINDVRESPALDIIEILLGKGADISYTDPYVPSLYSKTLDSELVSTPFDAKSLKQADCVVILTAHSCFDYALIAEGSRLVVDTRNALKGFSGENIIKL